MHQCSNFFLSISILKVQTSENINILQVLFWGFGGLLEVHDWGFVSWSWFVYGCWSLMHPWSKFLLSILILKMQRTSMSLKSWFGTLDDAGSSSLGFGTLILILIQSWVIHPPMFNCSKFCCCILILQVQEHPCPLSLHLGLWRMLKVPALSP